MVDVYYAILYAVGLSFDAEEGAAMETPFEDLHCPVRWMVGSA